MPTPRPRPRRRTVLAAGATALVGAGYVWGRGPEAIPLYGETVAFAAPPATLTHMDLMVPGFGTIADVPLH